MSDNLYNAVKYSTFPRLQTHPDRLAAVGTLFGMKPAPVRKCRVLEIGCGDANNLIPIAYALPDSQFTGIDLADEPIRNGLRTIHVMGLENIALKVADIRDIGPEYGEFDYILAHGVYSWVPADVREKLMAVCGERLAPEGVAMISYNAYPGWHARQMLREMMLYHTRKVTDPGQRVEQARWFVKFLLEGRSLSANWQGLLDEEANAALVRGTDSLFHDDLQVYNTPFYFRDFADHAARHGLQFLGEAEPHVMFDLRDEVAWLGDDILEREQYLDFLRAQRFRQTLLCRKEIPLRHGITPEDMEGFSFSTPATPGEDGQMTGLHSITITTAHEAVFRVAGAMGETYPLPLSFDELVPYAGDREALREILFGLVRGGFVNIHVFDFPCEESVTEKPRAYRLARHQAGESQFVTNACHHVVELDDVGRQLLILMDGTRDHEELASGLAGLPDMPPIETVREYLPACLERLAGMTLLEG